MRVVIAVTGGIAAYKVPSFISGLKNAVADEGNPFPEVYIITTEDALKFMTKLTLETSADRYVDSPSMFYEGKVHPSHILLSEISNMFIVVPATANIIGKIANGIADDLVTDTAIALPDSTVKIICPAMNTRMWENKAFQRNLAQLKEDEWQVVKPVKGMLACGTEGMGKLPSTRALVKSVLEMRN